MEREPIVKECIGCQRNVERFCMAYTRPSLKWSGEESSAYKRCPLSTHITEIIRDQKLVDPLKASKRKARGKH